MRHQIKIPLPPATGVLFFLLCLAPASPKAQLLNSDSPPAAQAVGWNAETQELMVPFWASNVMRGESILFIREKAGVRPVCGLLFTPTKILAVTNSAGDVTYRAGKDYQVKRGSRIISVPAGSAIPVTAAAKLTPPKGSQPYDLVRRDGKGDILFGSTTHDYADMQVVVTYEHNAKEWTLPPPKLAEKELPLTLAKLRQGAPLKMVLFGDSISVGCQASKWNAVPPFQPAYGELLAQALQAAYKSPIAFANVSKSGMGAEWGVQNISTVTAEKPDLVILAWGMNDSVASPTEAFIASLEKQMAAVRQVNPKAEFILVSSMLPNGDWYLAHPERVVQYRAAMRRLVKPGVAMADLTSVWEELLKHKDYLDITSNGVNHPNDFGHRLYAQVLGALLLPPAKPVNGHGAIPASGSRQENTHVIPPVQSGP